MPELSSEQLVEKIHPGADGIIEGTEAAKYHSVTGARQGHSVNRVTSMTSVVLICKMGHARLPPAEAAARVKCSDHLLQFAQAERDPGAGGGWGGCFGAQAKRLSKWALTERLPPSPRAFSQVLVSVPHVVLRIRVRRVRAASQEFSRQEGAGALGGRRKASVAGPPGQRGRRSQSQGQEKSQEARKQSPGIGVQSGRMRQTSQAEGLDGERAEQVKFITTCSQCRPPEGARPGLQAWGAQRTALGGWLSLLCGTFRNKATAGGCKAQVGAGGRVGRGLRSAAS